MSEPSSPQARIEELEAQLAQFRRSEADIIQARKELEESFGQLLKIQMFNRQALQCRSLEELLQHVLESAVAILGTEAGVLWLKDRSGDKRPAASCNIEIPPSTRLTEADVSSLLGSETIRTSALSPSLVGQLSRTMDHAIWISIRSKQPENLLLMVGVPNDKQAFYPPLDEANPIICRLFKEQADAVYAYFHEIEQRKLADIEAQKSDAYYQTILENAPVPIVQIDAKDVRRVLQSVPPGQYPPTRDMAAALLNIKLKQANVATTEFYGAGNLRSITDMLARSQLRVLLRCMEECHRQLLEGQRTVVAGSQFTHEGKRAVDFHVTVLPGDEHWENVLVAILDNTQAIEAEKIRIELESRMKRAEKMEALGILAGGVAHDLNNVLVSLVGMPDLLMEELRELPSAHEMAKAIRDAGLQASAFVQDLLTMSRRGIQQHGVLDMNEEIRRYINSHPCKALQDAYPGVEIHLDLSVPALPVNGSSIHLSKVFMNLVTNAFEAMGDSGTLIIRTRSISFEGAVVAYEEIPAGDYVQVDVQDNGKGIEPEHLPNIFEPFYTRKTMGQTSGTGLGMAVVWGVMRDHEGYIDVVTEPGKGTRFSLYLPLSSDAKPADIHEKTTSPEASKAHETILVVDDMEMQRNFMKRLLGRYAYQVHCVESGEKAIQWLRENEADMVLLDMIMDPGIDGLSTYEKVLEFKPDQPTILVSGYAATERVDRAMALGVRTFVKKPFRPNDLIRALQAELSQEARP